MLHISRNCINSSESSDVKHNTCLISYSLLNISLKIIHRSAYLFSNFFFENNLFKWSQYWALLTEQMHKNCFAPFWQTDNVFAHFQCNVFAHFKCISFNGRITDVGIRNRKSDWLNKGCPNYFDAVRHEKRLLFQDLHQTGHISSPVKGEQASPLNVFYRLFSNCMVNLGWPLNG